MTIAFVDGNAAFETPTITSTGADFVVLGLSVASAWAGKVDSKSNTLLVPYAYTDNSGPVSTATQYLESAAVGTSHSVGMGSFAYSGCFAAFSGIVASSAADGYNGAITSSVTATTLATGSVTPTATGNSCLIVTVLATPTTAGTITEPSGYTLIGKVDSVAGCNVAMAYKIQTTAGAAENATWNWTTSALASVAITAFKGAAGGGGGSTVGASLVGGKLTGGILFNGLKG